MDNPFLKPEVENKHALLTRLKEFRERLKAPLTAWKTILNDETNQEAVAQHPHSSQPVDPYQLIGKINGFEVTITQTINHIERDITSRCPNLADVCDSFALTKISDLKYHGGNNAHLSYLKRGLESLGKSDKFPAISQAAHDATKQVVDLCTEYKADIAAATHLALYHQLETLYAGQTR